MSSYKKYFITMSLLLFASALFAQSLRITGKVFPDFVNVSPKNSHQII